MKRPQLLHVLALLGLPFFQTGVAQKVSLSESSGVTFIKGTQTRSLEQQTAIPTGPYLSYTTQITVNYSSTTTSSASSVSHRSMSGVVPLASTAIIPNITATGPSLPALPQNTQPCNNYVEFCTRKYSNITMVAAHNSPFVRPGNAASNQDLDVEDQLNDGIRLLQGQMHFPGNSTVPHFCHTSCDELDVGPITDYLTKVRKWVDKHPYDVVTLILENGNFSKPEAYAPYIAQTGLLKYAYEPPYIPMKRDNWPTLGNMLLRGKRVVLFIDYMGNQTAFPWWLDEFSQMWETPFDPTNRSFPCTVQRPPGLSDKDAEERMYMINHNLNVEFSIFGEDILVPAVTLLNQTNAVSGYGSLGLTANNCRNDWGLPPNFMDVDYFNYGNFPGSVFEVAAMINNVTYNRTCCGVVSAADMVRGRAASWAMATAATVLATILMI